MDQTSAVTEVPAQTPAVHHQDVNILNPDVSMVILTWVTFFSLLIILQKFGFKPILAAVQKREDDIKRSLEEADKIHQQFSEIEANRTKIIQEAHVKSQEIMEQSRRSALELSRVPSAALCVCTESAISPCAMRPLPQRNKPFCSNRSWTSSASSTRTFSRET